MGFESSKWLLLASLLLLVVVHVPPAAALVVPSKLLCSNLKQSSSFSSSSSSALGYRNLPSVDEVSNDEFTEQVYHGSSIVRELSASLLFRGGRDSQEKENTSNSEKLAFFASPAAAAPSSLPSSASAASSPPDEEETSIISARNQLVQLLAAQLSHEDGIRGFFVAYLTGEGRDTTADAEQVPVLLAEAMKQSNFEYLTYSLCMNLITPTAMISVYDQQNQQPLAQNSAVVAQRTKRIMASLQGSINMVKNWEAIIVAAKKKTNLNDEVSKADEAQQNNSKLVQVRSVPLSTRAFVYFVITNGISRSRSFLLALSSFT